MNDCDWKRICVIAQVDRVIPKDEEEFYWQRAPLFFDSHAGILIKLGHINSETGEHHILMSKLSGLPDNATWEEQRVFTDSDFIYTYADLNPGYWLITDRFQVLNPPHRSYGTLWSYEGKDNYGILVSGTN